RRRGAPGYPFHASMKGLEPRVRAFCERELLLVKRYRILGVEYALYARPALRLGGDRDGWVTDRGLTLTGPGAALRKRPTVRLAGKIDLRLLGKAPGVAGEPPRPRGPPAAPAAPRR